MALCRGEKLIISMNSRRTHHLENGHFAISMGQLCLLSVLLLFGCSLILATIESAAISAALLLGLVSVIGLLLCRNTQVQLGDPSLKILGYLWLIKLGATLFLLYA